MSETPKKSAPATDSPKSSPTKKEIDTATQALNHFAQGKRHLVVGDIPSAVNSLQEACRFLAEEYGETAPECGDAYYHYGQALLELARIENGVLGNALDGEEGSTEDEEEEGDGDEVEEDGDGEGDDAEVGEGEKTKDGESKDEDGNKEENGSQGSGEGEKTEEDEEEVSNLQLAWEMLELAKVIFQKQEEGNPEMGKKVAQVYLKLGEVGVESENYPQGIEDFKQCLKVQERILEEDDRCLAETHYQLGVAHSFSDDFDMAMEGFTAAIEVIELRINNLNKRKKEKESWTEEQRTKDAAERPDPFYTEQGEIDELNLLLPEIKEKIIDMQQMKNDTKEKLQKAAKEAMKAQQIAGKTRVNPFGESSSSGFDAPSSGFDAPSSSTSSGASAAKPITHLVRKKQRKAEEDDKEEDQKKKVRGENGEAVPVKSETENTNGQAEKMDTNEESTKKTTKDLKKKVADDKKKREEIAQKDTKA